MTKADQPIAPITIALVGDVHDQWETADGDALAGLGVDLVLFVGDFGNESVAIVRQVAQLDLPKAVMLGNHDAWYSATHGGKTHCPYDRTKEDWVQLQLDLLGDDFVGYRPKDFPALGLSVVGSRPFSWGGPIWKNSSFYKTRFGVTGFADSTQRLVSAIASSAFETVLMLGHNGPTGLGDSRESICGKDWGELGGDYGDPDLASAIATGRDQGKHIPLMAFGHMHHRLRHRQDQPRQLIQHVPHTLYVNAAAVPRIINPAVNPFGDRERWHNFTLVTLTDRTVTRVALVWTDRQGQIKSEQVTYCAEIP
jgi:uncharacterized protein (TIGR04168 family)